MKSPKQKRKWRKRKKEKRREVWDGQFQIVYTHTHYTSKHQRHLTYSIDEASSHYVHWHNR